MGVSLDSPRFLSNGWGPPHFATLSDSLAIYKPSGTKIVDTATGMATVSGPERRTLADLSGDLTQPMSRGV